MSEYLTATQAAQRLGTSLTNVARWCRDGTLPATRLGIGRIWQIPVEAVEHFTPPARGPKPVGERKRLLEMAQEIAEFHPELLKSTEPMADLFEHHVKELTSLGHCTRARARQALAKAIRIARGAQVKADE